MSSAWLERRPCQGVMVVAFAHSSAAAFARLMPSVARRRDAFLYKLLHLPA
jgi:hypothetical protein